MKPTIAITMGDAAGIGPELIVKVLTEGKFKNDCNPFVVGDLQVLTETSAIVGSPLRFRSIKRLSEASFSPDCIDVLCPEEAHISHLTRGKVDPILGRAAILCLRKSYELAMKGQVHGVVSAPLNKEAFHLAGFHYLDELAYLADFTDSRETYTIGVVGPLWTTAVTEHIPFKEIVGLINKERVHWSIRVLNSALQKAGFNAPRIAVAALNVHGGEGGLFGREEIDEITPAIHQASREGINVQGPVPADMIFVKALQGQYDGIVSMYHDQANIARKLQPKNKCATIFMGLPVICGTTAHGTAFDIAGKGIADSGSFAAALEYTIRLAAITVN